MATPFGAGLGGRFRGNQALLLPLHLPQPVWALSVQSLVPGLRSTGWLSWCLLSSHCNCRILAPAHKPSAPLPRVAGSTFLHILATAASGRQHGREKVQQLVGASGSTVTFPTTSLALQCGQASAPPQEWAPTTLVPNLLRVHDKTPPSLGLGFPI